MFARARRVDGPTGRRRPDEPRQTCSDSWDLDPDKLIRPRSADSIKACGHYAAPIGRTHDRKRLLLLVTLKVLAGRGPSTHESLPNTQCGRSSVVAYDPSGVRVLRGC